MADISGTITAKSDQLNACDLLGGGIQVIVENVTVTAGDQPVSIFIENNKPFKPCLSVRRILAKLWGTDSSKWIGRSMTLFCDSTVKWAGEKAGGIRISHLSNINGKQEVITRASKHKVTTYIINELKLDFSKEIETEVSALNECKTMDELGTVFKASKHQKAITQAKDAMKAKLGHNDE